MIFYLRSAECFFHGLRGGWGGGGYGYFLELHNVTKFQKITNNVKLFTTRLQRDLTYSNSPNLQGNLCPVSSRLSRIILPNILRCFNYYSKEKSRTKCNQMPRKDYEQ